jgi:hypothetical protein
MTFFQIATLFLETNEKHPAVVAAIGMSRNSLFTRED